MARHHIAPFFLTKYFLAFYDPVDGQLIGANLCFNDVELTAPISV